MLKLFSIILLLITVSSCISSVEKHGYMFDLSDHETLQEGITSKERVLRIMGSPTVISDLSGDEAWIYYSEEVNKFLFFKPNIIERNILVIKFNKIDTIKQIEKFDLANEDKSLNFVQEYTAVDSHKTGFFKSIFSNVGQVKAQ